MGSHVTSSIKQWLTVWLTLTAVVVLAASACGGGNQEPLPNADESADPWAVAQVDPEAVWLPVLATQDLAVGVKRIAFSVNGLTANEEPPTVRASLFALDVDRESPRSVQYARFIANDPSVGMMAHGHARSSVSDRALPIGRGVFVVPVQLTAPGLWGVLLEMRSEARSESVRLRFSVRERAAAPRVGERAPSVDSRTRADVSTLQELTSDPDPEPGLRSVTREPVRRRWRRSRRSGASTRRS